MPESKSGALPLGDSPSEAVTISFCGEFAQGMMVETARRKQRGAAGEFSGCVVRLGGPVVDPLQKLPVVALAVTGGPPPGLGFRKAAVDDSKDRRTRSGHPRGGIGSAPGAGKVSLVESLDRCRNSIVQPDSNRLQIVAPEAEWKCIR